MNIILLKQYLYLVDKKVIYILIYLFEIYLMKQQKYKQNKFRALRNISCYTYSISLLVEYVVINISDYSIIICLRNDDRSLHNTDQ